jgi:hypothetical protein
MSTFFNYDAVVYSKNVEEYQNMFSTKQSAKCSLDSTDMIINLKFGKTYYMYDKESKNLVAFKIRAFSVRIKRYLIQTPSKFEWMVLDTDSVIFNSKEEYFLYLSNKAKPIVLEQERLYVGRLPHFHSQYGCGNHLYNAFYWSETEAKPIEWQSYVYDALYVESGIIVYYELRHNCFDTYEECVKHQLDGMCVEEFAEDVFPTISITFKGETNPIIHTLRFIED